MRIYPVSPERAQSEGLREAARVLRAGGLVAFPTETVYGLGANALDAAAVQRIFAAKGRPSYNPLIVHVAHADAARALVRAWPEAAERLARAFWPGPLTLVLPKQPQVPDAVTAGLPTVALRVPAHPVALALLESCALPLAAPSANRFTQLSPTTAAHVARSLGERVDVILDGGPTSVGIESTVLDLSEGEPLLLRPGTLPLDRIESVVGPVRAPARAPAGEAPRRAPGMLDRHYAPRAELRLFESAAREAAAARAAQATAAGGVVGALLLHPLDAPVQHPLVMPPDPAEYARRLYAALHTLDERGCSLILVEWPPADAAWLGVRDRLQRAAAP